MKIRISDLPDEGREITEGLPAAHLTQRINDGVATDIRFLADPQVSIVVNKLAEGAEIRGTIEAKYTQSCGRCLEDFERQLDLPVYFVLTPRTENGEDQEDSVGYYFFEGEYAELDEALEEAIILSLSLYWKPELTYKSKCVECKKDFSDLQKRPPETKINLGEMLKKAGLN